MYYAVLDTCSSSSNMSVECISLQHSWECEHTDLVWCARSQAQQACGS
jgi:hypothetical protein